jgi:tripartite-type tricarboxylate transporter receptor subunit TctC
MVMFKQFSASLLVTLSALLGQSALAQDYPQGPLTMIVPFAPGGSTDIIGRMVAERLSAVLKQPVVVENRAGAGGNIGAMAVAKAKPDGRTMLFGTTGILSINEFIYPNPGYKIGQDLIPVVYATSISNVLILNKNLPVASVADLIKLAKEKPGKLSFGSSGAGSSTHLSGELFKVMAGVDITHIPYKGSSQALIDLMGGQIDMIFDNAPSAVPLLESGQVKALAITSMEPLSVLPQVPTMDQAGVKGYESLSWTGIVVPGGTPPAVIERLNHEVNLILQEPQVLKKLDELGARPTGGSQQAFAAHIESERTKWGKIVRETHIQAQ